MISFIPMLLLMQVRDLRRLVPFAVLANVLAVIGLGIFIYFISLDFPGFEDSKKFGTLMDFSHFIGTALFSLSAVGVVSGIFMLFKLKKTKKCYVFIT